VHATALEREAEAHALVARTWASARSCSTAARDRA